jgi:hypothetical protein
LIQESVERHEKCEAVHGSAFEAVVDRADDDVVFEPENLGELVRDPTTHHVPVYRLRSYFSPEQRSIALELHCSNGIPIAETVGVRGRRVRRHEDAAFFLLALAEVPR